MADKIILTGMEFYCYHGVLPAERELGQRLVVDLELFLDLSGAGQKDDLSATVDYAAVFRLVEKVAGGPSRSLLEKVAEDIAAAVLGSFPVEEVVVRVTKPSPPLPGRLACAAVEIRRRRNQAERAGPETLPPERGARERAAP
jgi:dihydroneopterin aldolase